MATTIETLYRHNKWPSWLLACFIILFFGLLLVFVYEQTKSSYLSVGINHGEVLAKIEIMKKLREYNLPLSDCHHITQPTRELFSVKAESLQIVGTDKGVGFCEYR